MVLENYVRGEWVRGGGATASLQDATTGADIAAIGTLNADLGAVVGHARDVGGRNLRRMTFQARAALLKSLAKALSEHKQELYQISQTTGATRADCMLDVDGGLGTLFSYASRGQKELPDSNVFLEGATESLSRTGGFVGQHICVPLEGVAVHINAYNFPVWGMLEKLAPTLLAGVPAIVKPASATAPVAVELMRQIVATGLLPAGAVQMICGGVGDLLDRLGCQDVVAFTGSAGTAQKLRALPNIIRNSVRFTAETDSLNASILGPDATPGSEPFKLFIAEVLREMTCKSGQRCTAIRRVLVPQARLEAVSAALKAAFDAIVVGDPRNPEVQMGPLVGLAQREDVLAKIKLLQQEAELLTGDPHAVRPRGADADQGAFLAPTLLRVRDASSARRVHEVEAFGPVCTLLPYDSVAQAIELARKGEGSLVASVFTADHAAARDLVLGLAPYHGRVLVVDPACAAEQTGHGSPLPGLIHGGPGRAGGGEELGGIRAVLHYLQRTAVQCSPAMLATLNPPQPTRG